MKVIEPGTGRKRWEKEFTCTGMGFTNDGCGAKLLVEEVDLYQVNLGSSGMDESPDEYCFAFICPECGAESRVDSVLLPQHVQGRIPSKPAWKRRQAETKSTPAVSVAEVAQSLVGVEFPTGRGDLVHRARYNRIRGYETIREETIEFLGRMPEKQYVSLADVEFEFYRVGHPPTRLREKLEDEWAQEEIKENAAKADPDNSGSGHGRK